MRIAYDPQIFFHQRYGGISRYFTEVAKGVRDHGHTPGVFAPNDSNYYLEQSKLPIIEASRLASVYAKLPSRLKRGRHPYECPPVRWEIRERMSKWKPDVVHETYYYDQKLGPVGIPTVLTVYDMIHEIFPTSFESSNPTQKLKKQAVANADAIICISHSTAKDLHEILDVPYSKISVTHLGWEILTAASVSEITPPISRKPYFLFVGSRTGYKNFMGLLRAFAADSRLRVDFDLIAFGGGAFDNAEIELISRLGLTSVVHHSPGDDKVLGSLYTTARAFVYPSLYEGFGLPPLEAMAHHCPVISSNTSSMPEVIGDAGRFFDPTIIESMTEALADIGYSDEAHARLIQKGQERLCVFSWEKCAAETLAVYQSLG